MDDTTCQFSRKVLDRAMTLLMNEVKFGSMAQSKKPSEEELLDDDGLNFFLEGKERGDVGETESESRGDRPFGSTSRSSLHIL